VKPQKMLVKHAPANGSYGDCFRVTIASLLNLEAAEVPHVFSKGEEGAEAHAAMGAWLAERGLILIWIPFPGEASLRDVMAVTKRENQGIPYIVCGESRPGCGHFVACLDGKIVCDPSPSDAGLSGPTDGMWHVGFIGSAVVLQEPTP